jgi:phosphoribosylglycinamide formyltransferase-1
VLKVAVLVSGRGSNLQALIDATKHPNFPAQISCVISNEPDAGGLDRARAANIPALTINHRDFKDKTSFEQALDTKFVENGIHLICLAGFMRLLSPWFVDRWRDRLINIHPSLLPAFTGLHTHQKALDYGVKFTGCTIHFVRAEMDHGPIIIQSAVPVLPDDTEDSLAARVLKAEHRAYPTALRWIAEGKVNVLNEKVFIVGAKTDDATDFNPSL